MKRIMLIKRYLSGKLYLTIESRYVTLAEVAGFYKSGADLLIIDNKTKRDVTQEVLSSLEVSK